MSAMGDVEFVRCANCDRILEDYEHNCSGCGAEVEDGDE